MSVPHILVSLEKIRESFRFMTPKKFPKFAVSNRESERIQTSCTQKLLK